MLDKLLQPWKIGTFFKVPIFVDSSFTILAVVSTLFSVLNHGIYGLIPSFFLISILAFTILSHEYGHVLMARKYQIDTKMITLHFFGGLALLNGRPKAKEEIPIAAAGPAVNLGLAGIVILLSWLLPINEIDAIYKFVYLNLFVGLFNLIPLYPLLDGGKILGASLSLSSLGEQRGRKIALNVGEAIAWIFLVIGIWKFQIMLMILAFISFMAVRAERNRF